MEFSLDGLRPGTRPADQGHRGCARQLRLGLRRRQSHSSAAEPSHAYTTGGSKLVTLTVTDTDDGLSSQATKVILVHAANIPPKPSFNWSPQRPGTGQLVLFFNGTTDDDDGNANLTYNWDFGDGATSTETSPTHTYANPGDYFVTLTAHDPNGGTAVEGFTVQVLLDALVAPTNQMLPAITGTAESGHRHGVGRHVERDEPDPLLLLVASLRLCGRELCADRVVQLGVHARRRRRRPHAQGPRHGVERPGWCVRRLRADSGVVGVPPQNTTIPSITGSPQDGQLLGVTPGSWTGNGTITLSYQWLRCDNAGGNCATIDFATATTYRAAPADEGHAIRVRETATDDIGTASADSTATAPIAPGSPVNLTPASLFGTARDGSSLTAANGTWAGSPPITFGYQWQRCDTIADCANIAGVNATLQSYQLTSADVGHKVRAIVTARTESARRPPRRRTCPTPLSQRRRATPRSRRLPERRPRVRTSRRTTAPGPARRRSRSPASGSGATTSAMHARTSAARPARPTS